MTKAPGRIRSMEPSLWGAVLLAAGLTLLFVPLGLGALVTWLAVRR